MKLFTLLLIFFTAMTQSQVSFVNWENHPIHAIDISPDKNRMAVAHTADNRVQLFDISLGYPVKLGHVKVGINPVSVRFQNNEKLWAVNHISDSVSVIDFTDRKVTQTLHTNDEPFDVVFANGKAFVSCSQPNQVQIFSADQGDLLQTIELIAEEPRSMVVNSDGTKIYVAAFESGNRTTVLAGDRNESDGQLGFPFNPVNRDFSPYRGVNPPPNDGEVFMPLVNPDNPPAPKVSLIVKQNAEGRWLDDNRMDWTHVVSGDQAPGSGRIEGWKLLDHDIAVIDTTTYEVSYIENLMNIGMALGFNSAKNKITLVGTDAINEVRYEPNLRSTFVRVKAAMVDAETFESTVLDLNSHLDYQQRSVEQKIRNLSTGDPRGVTWNAAGDKGYIAGMGSNNVIVIDEDGERLANIDVGEGPVGMVLDENHKRMYVWNHFEASLSIVDTTTQLEIRRIAVFNPLPSAIKEGRKFLYSTHETSGLGQASCASCHVDGRIDRLAWDLGDPAGEVKAFNQNCQTTALNLINRGCDDFHPMKGPMLTQTFQDIIGHEPFHWRGDRDGIEEFNGAFVHLNGSDSLLSVEDMQAFKDMLSSITFAPNPFRNIDNSLPESVDLSQQYTSGRFAPAGEPLGDGDPHNGLRLFNSNLLDGVFQCASCHTIPTGMAVNGPLLLGSLNISVGGEIMPFGPSMENHLGIVSVDGGTQKSFKTPQLRNMYEKVGFEMSQQESLSGFGFLHDGSVDSLSRFISAQAFSVDSDQDVADLVALMMAFSGSDLDPGFVPLGSDAPISQDTHAGVGQQYTLAQAVQIDAVIDEFVLIAEHPKVDLMVSTSNNESYLYDDDNNVFVSSTGELLTSVALMAIASSERVLTYQLIPEDLGQNMAFDRDGDDINDQQELIDGSNPADALSFGIVPRAGIWYNPARDGHGADIQMAGENLLVVWYTYEDNGTPTWYLSTGPYQPDWSAPLLKVQWDHSTNTTESQEVGTLMLNFSDARNTTFAWEILGESGQEDFRYFQFADGDTINQKTGTYYDINNPGWGVSINTQGQRQVAVVYYYDEIGNPRWAIGNGSNSNASMIEMLSVTGFCPGCDYQAPVNENIGSVSIEYAESDISNFSVILDYPQNNSDLWQIINRPLNPISSDFQAPENN